MDDQVFLSSIELMSQKKGKKDVVQQRSKFTPMPRNWPGKISNPDLFHEFHDKVQSSIQSRLNYPMVNILVQQLGVSDGNSFLITIPKTTILFRLKCMIAEIVHDNSVLIDDIVIFKEQTKTPAEHLMVMPRDIPTVDRIRQDNLSIGIPQDLVIFNDKLPLVDCFAEVKGFRCSEDQVILN
jgi:hypothetical protein